MTNLADMWDESDYIIAGESPFYTDFLYHVQEDYPNAGIKAVLVGLTPTEQSELSYLYAHSSQIIEHFNIKYKYREIGSETESRWQYEISKIFDNVKRVYNRWFMLYETNNVNLLAKELTETFSRSGSSSAESSSESSGTGKSVFQDTPVQALVSTGNYATNITDDTSSSESSGTNGTEFSEEYTKTKSDKDKTNLELINKNVAIWNDLIDRFVSEFDVCFMDVPTKL